MLAYLLSHYLIDQMENDSNSECVKSVCKTNLFSIEHCELNFIRANYEKFALDDSSELSRLKSLRKQLNIA